MGPTISLAIHVTAAALLVGPQLLMFFAVVPATWLIEDDERLKRALLRVIAGRFGMLATISIVVLVITGVYQYAIVPEGVRDSSTSRFSLIFSTKIMIFFLVMVMIGVHTRLYGRRITRLSDEVIALESDPSSARREEGRVRAVELERARTQSFTFSALILVASLITLWLGVALGNESFSWAQR